MSPLAEQLNTELRQWCSNQKWSKCSSCQVVVLRRSCIVFHMFLHTRSIVTLCVWLRHLFQARLVESWEVCGMRDFHELRGTGSPKQLIKSRVSVLLFFLSLASTWLVVSRLSPLTTWRLPAFILSTSPLAKSQWAVQSTYSTKSYPRFCLQSRISMVPRRV